MVAPLVFSIHSPLAGRDKNGYHRGGQCSLFFNPLAPCGARPAGELAGYMILTFSIHSPLAGRDFMTKAASCWAYCFQSTRPLRGETAKACYGINGVLFSIHSPLAGRDKQRKAQKGHNTLFNPLAPCGARRFIIPSPPTRSCLFNPLAPCGARQPVSRRLMLVPLFQSTRPLRGETFRLA